MMVVVILRRMTPFADNDEDDGNDNNVDGGGDDLDDGDGDDWK